MNVEPTMSDQDPRAPQSRLPRFAKIAAVIVLTAGVGIALLPLDGCACGTYGRRSALASSLRSLVNAQEAFLADSQRYATDLAALTFRPDTNIQVTFDTVHGTGYRARARYVGVVYAEAIGACGVWVGDPRVAFAEAAEGAPQCWPPRRKLWRFGRYRSTEPPPR